MAFHDPPFFSTMDNCQKQPFDILECPAGMNKTLNIEVSIKNDTAWKGIITLTSSLSSDHILCTEGFRFPVASTDFCAAAALPVLFNHLFCFLFCVQ